MKEHACLEGLLLKALDCRVPLHHRETLAEVIQLLGVFNLKQLNLWMQIRSFSLWFVEEGEPRGPLAGSSKRRLVGSRAVTCFLCQPHSTVVSYGEHILFVQRVFVKTEIFRCTAIMEHSHIQNLAKLPHKAHGNDAKNTCLPRNSHENMILLTLFLLIHVAQNWPWKYNFVDLGWVQGYS